MLNPPSVEIFVPVRNEEKFLKYFHDFYQSRLSNVAFTLLDMGSVDSTVDIANNLGMNIVIRPEQFFSDRTNFEFKSTWWRNSKADFVIIQDLDELLDIDDEFLISNEFSCIQAEAWDMVGEGQPFGEITKAVRLPFYDKCLMFKVSDFFELEFSPGAHQVAWASNIPNPVFLSRPMYHFNRLSLDHVLQKYESRRTRLSEENIESGWGVQYLLSEAEIREEYAGTLDTAIHIFGVNAALSPDYNPLEPVVTFYRKHFGALARTIVDIGSRDGDDAEYLRAALYGQKVIAIEADPASADLIRQSHPGFFVWCTGVSNFNGVSSFQRVISDNKEHRGPSSISSTSAVSPYEFETVEIPITTMKELLVSNFMQHDILDVVKIDCEGFTFQVLEGFEAFIKNVKLFHLETEHTATHPDHMDTQEVTEFMTRNNFALVEISSEWGEGIVDQVWVNRDLVVYQKNML